MFRQHRRSPEPPLDLDTVRETLDYMQADMTGREGYENVARALRRAMDEIDALPCRNARSRPASDRHVFSARFLPARLSSR